MKFVLIYGPPAVGKLTVANEIARRTGFKVFHNHLTVDLVDSVFPRGTPSFAKLIWEIRLAIFAEAAQAKVGGSLTLCGGNAARKSECGHGRIESGGSGAKGHLPLPAPVNLWYGNDPIEHGGSTE